MTQRLRYMTLKVYENTWENVNTFKKIHPRLTQNMVLATIFNFFNKSETARKVLIENLRYEGENCTIKWGRPFKEAPQ